MNPMKILNVSLILVPLVCLLVGSNQVYGKWRHIGQLQNELRQMEAQIAITDRTLAAGAGMPAYKQAPTAEQTAAEQAQFLNQLHGEAKTTGVQITTWLNSVSSGATTDAAPVGASQSAHQLPAGINSITSHVEVVGSFQGLRQFLYHLQRTPRLLNLSSPQWTRNQWPMTHLTFTLTRYVTPEAAPITAPEGRVAQAPHSPVGTRSGS